ncbi:hypothetical protein [Micromonospora sp. NPDC005367]|uniref:hypothetical protein n=1 Tax=Micromonospora sp. NPDC005367 TaxID=3155590 RepID=UPI0033BFA385
MATVDEGQPTGTDPAPSTGRPRWGIFLTAAATVIGLLIGGGSLLRDYFGWENSPDAVAASPTAHSDAPTGSTGPEAGASSGTVPSTRTAGTHLAGLPAQGGASNLVALPRALARQPGYERSIVVTCPENTPRDPHHEVTYPLHQRYLDLTATIRPYSPDDPLAKVYVSVIVAEKQDDGTVNRITRGGAEARQDSTNTLSASVEGADEVTLRIDCELPTTLVVLSDAMITPA